MRHARLVVIILFCEKRVTLGKDDEKRKKEYCVKRED